MRILLVSIFLFPFAVSADPGNTQGGSIDAGGMPVCLANLADARAQVSALEAQVASLQQQLADKSAAFDTCVANLDTCDASLSSCGADSGAGQCATAAHPAPSCAALKAVGAGSGVYWVNPPGVPAFQVYCDMQIDGGIGAALVATVGSPNHGNNPYGIINKADATADLPMPAAWPDTPNRKLSDAQINALKSQSAFVNAYRVSCGTPEIPQTRWFRTSCAFHADQTPHGACTGGASSMTATDWHYNGNDFGWGLDADEFGSGSDKVVFLSPQGNFGNGGCYGISDSTIGENTGSLYVE